MFTSIFHHTCTIYCLVTETNLKTTMSIAQANNFFSFFNGLKLINEALKMPSSSSLGSFAPPNLIAPTLQRS